VAAERVVVERHRDEGLDGLPDDISHLRITAAHDRRGLD
jgi:hypothetical protein